jgi:hypothetical protein
MARAEVEQLHDEIMHRLLPTYAPTPERFAALHRARDAMTVLIGAACYLAFDEDEKRTPWAAGAANCAWTALSGRKAEPVARLALIERIDGTAKLVNARGADSLGALADFAAIAFRSEWPEYGQATGADFAEAVARWRASVATPRNGKWQSVGALMRKAGLAPPSTASLVSEWSRHLRERRRRSDALRSRIKDSGARD